MTTEFRPTFFQNLRAGDGTSVETAAFEAKVREFLRGHDAHLEDKYRESLMTVTKPEAVIISLDQIPAGCRDTRIEQLRAKAIEYDLRIPYQLKTFVGLRRPDIDSFTLNLYKRDVLRLLLRYGSINTFALCRAEMTALDANKLGLNFGLACRVVDEYVQHGRAINGHPGNGLPEVA